MINLHNINLAALWVSESRGGESNEEAFVYISARDHDDMDQVKYSEYGENYNEIIFGSQNDMIC